MPLYRMGDLKGSIKKRIILSGAAGRRQRVDIAHGLLSAGELSRTRHCHDLLRNAFSTTQLFPDLTVGCHYLM